LACPAFKELGLPWGVLRVKLVEKVEAPLRNGKVTEHPLDPAVRDVLERVMDSEGVLLGRK
jgi:hypothetical protein